MSVISVILRQFYLPNPFENFENGYLYNWAASLILPSITYAIVGLFYREKSNPVLGSFLFLFFYVINIWAISICGYFSFNVIFLCIFIIIYFIAIFVALNLTNKIRQAYYTIE